MPERGGPAFTRGWILFIILGAAALDYLFLVGLPAAGLSFGPVGSSWLFLAVARLLVDAGLLLALAVLFRLKPAPPPVRHRVPVSLLAAANAFILGAMVWSMAVEPFWLTTTRLNLPGPPAENGRPLRIVHLTDIHVERITRREVDLIAQVASLQPDLILMTGDYPNIDYNTDVQTLQDTRKVLVQLHAHYGVYAVPGSPPVDIPPALAAIFQGTSIVLLQDELRRLPLPGGELALLGIANSTHARDAGVLAGLARQVPLGDYTILLYHTPDLAAEARQAGVDLYLAGHTHGGQVRLPFYGAVITMSRFGKTFESGRFELGATTLYVSRGIGMEGLHLPRLRLLCPPEIVYIELGGNQE